MSSAHLSFTIWLTSWTSQYLENLCDYLYDDLRPRILHEPRLTALCEVCTVLQALMVLDVPALEDMPDEEDEVLTMEPRSQKRTGLGSLHIGQLLQMVLQDAQTRLFFKAQSVIQSDIRYYQPKPDDLAYPDKLVSKYAQTEILDVLTRIPHSRKEANNRVRDPGKRKC